MNYYALKDGVFFAVYDKGIETNLGEGLEST